VVELTGKKDFSFILGGTHLKNASNKRIDETIAALREFNIKKLVLSHCTGIPAFIRIREALGDKVSLSHVGESWQIAV